MSAHSHAVPNGRRAADIRKAEPRSRPGKVANKCRKLWGPDRVGREWDRRSGHQHGGAGAGRGAEEAFGAHIVNNTDAQRSYYFPPPTAPSAGISLSQTLDQKPWVEQSLGFAAVETRCKVLPGPTELPWQLDTSQQPPNVCQAVIYPLLDRWLLACLGPAAQPHLHSQLLSPFASSWSRPDSPCLCILDPPREPLKSVQVAPFNSGFSTAWRNGQGQIAPWLCASVSPIVTWE